MRQQVGGGGAAIGGLACMIALLAAEAEIEANLWGTFWFPAFFAASAVCMLVGVYVLLSAYVPLPMLRTLEQRGRTERLNVSDGISAVLIKGSQVPGIRVVEFDTVSGRSDRELRVQGKPRKLRFLEPVETKSAIEASDLPHRVRRRFRTFLVVKAFTTKGFVVDEKTSAPVVRVEVYYEDEVP